MNSIDFFIMPARGCLILGALFCVYLLACGINALIEWVLYHPDPDYRRKRK